MCFWPKDVDVLPTTQNSNVGGLKLRLKVSPDNTGLSYKRMYLHLLVENTYSSLCWECSSQIYTWQPAPPVGHLVSEWAWRASSCSDPCGLTQADRCQS
jgi:hypothetical protein